VGSVLSASGLTVLVFGVLQASNWGWLRPHNSPITPFGFSLTPFVLAAAGLLLAGFVSWERRREARGEEPLLRLDLLKIPSLRAPRPSRFPQSSRSCRRGRCGFTGRLRPANAIIPVALFSVT
jgi:hypothetical protein